MFKKFIAHNVTGINEVFNKRDYLHTLPMTTKVNRKHESSMTDKNPFIKNLHLSICSVQLLPMHFIQSDKTFLLKLFFWGGFLIIQF